MHDTTVYRYKNLLNDAGIETIDKLESLSDDKLMSTVYQTLDMSSVKGNTAEVTRQNPELHLLYFKESVAKLPKNVSARKE